MFSFTLIVILHYQRIDEYYFITEFTQIAFLMTERAGISCLRVFWKLLQTLTYSMSQQPLKSFDHPLMSFSLSN